jgi:methionyl-tRNA formyltransferase
MLLARPLLIGARETGGQLHDRLAALGAEAIVAAVQQCLASRLVAAGQPDEGAAYAAKIRKEEAVIDWRQSATQIDRQVRAFNPWPVAETRWQGRQLRIWEAESVAAGGGAEPGEVLEAAGGRLLVAAGEGALQLHRVQLAGRRAMTSAEFLNAHPLAGARLGG